MSWPFSRRKKSAFKASFYEKPKQQEEFPQMSTKDSDDKPHKVTVFRGKGEEYSEALTDKAFGLILDLDKNELSSEKMAVAVLMDIRERLDKIIGLLNKSSAEPITVNKESVEPTTAPPVPKPIDPEAWERLAKGLSLDPVEHINQLTDPDWKEKLKTEINSVTLYHGDSLHE